jgi:enoyl-CoA hydratase/carnithine racemase
MGKKNKRLKYDGKTKEVGVVSIDHMPCSPDEAFYRFQGLAEQCLGMAASDRIRVVVCQCGSRPGDFAALDAYGTALASSVVGSFQRPSLVDALADTPQPVIIAIDGNVMGIELELALAGDIRICSETSQFGFPQICHAEIPCFGGTQRLARLVGKGKAMEMLLTGDPIDAGHAFDIGLVNKVVPAADLDAEVHDLAVSMAAKGPIALQFAKEAVTAGLEMTIGKGLRLEADLYFLLHTTRDRTEGVRAFQEKRQARFQGL